MPTGLKNPRLVFYHWTAPILRTSNDSNLLIMTLSSEMIRQMLKVQVSHKPLLRSRLHSGHLSFFLAPEVSLQVLSARAETCAILCWCEQKMPCLGSRALTASALTALRSWPAPSIP